jgi:hypothetical protein
MIVHRTFGEMYNLRVIAKIIMKLPLDLPQDDLRAGPPFEMPYAIALPAAERDCWRVHMDLLEASLTLNGTIASHADAQEKDYLKSLAGLDRETMTAIGAMMRSGDGLGLRTVRSAI